jgi:hypothetical protein
MVDEKPKRTRKRNASVEIRDSTIGTGGGDIVGQEFSAERFTLTR